jgi:hypothetical protein
MNAKLERKGFAMSLEALCSIILLIVALSAMRLFLLPAQHASDFYLCSDAAMLLSSQGISQAELQAQVDALSSLSGRCISYESEKARASSCELSQTPHERFAFTIAVFEDGSAGKAQITCWQAE